MLRTWSFWKRFFAYYLALVVGVWAFVEASAYFTGESLKPLLGPNWWVLYYVLPLFIAFAASAAANRQE
jgi:hypothetical protein